MAERWCRHGSVCGQLDTRSGLLRPRPPVGINNPIPGTFARVVPEGTPLETLGKPGAIDVLVTDSAAIRGMSACELSKALEIQPASGYHIIELNRQESKELQRRYLETILYSLEEVSRLAECPNTLYLTGRCRQALSLGRSDNQFAAR